MDRIDDGDLEKIKELIEKIKSMEAWHAAALANFLAEIGAMKTVSRASLNEWIKFFSICAFVVILTYLFKKHGSYH